MKVLDNPDPFPFLTCGIYKDDDGIDCIRIKGKKIWLIYSIEDWNEYIGQATEDDFTFGVNCSSSIDFPEDSTANEDLITIANHIATS